MSGKVLVTGVPGNVGSEVIKNLKKLGIAFKAGVRNIKKAQDTLGNDIDYVYFDFEKSESFEDAFKDVDKLFLMRPPAISDVKKYINPVIDYAKTAGVKHIVFLSLMGIEHNPIPPHYKIEKYIKKTGINYTFLRPSFFMQNLDTTHKYDIKERNDIFIPAGKAKVSFIDVRDIGEAAAKVFSESGHENKAYTLTGSEALDYYQAADIFTKVLGRKITYSNPSPLKFRKVMIERGTNSSFVNIMVALYITTRLGMAKDVTPDLKLLLGRDAITLEHYIMDYCDNWK